MTPIEYCREKVAGTGSSLYYSLLFAPPESRAALTVLYAFCRETNDILEECSDAGVARLRLEWWRRELAATFAGHPGHPVSRALLPVVQRHRLGEARLRDIIDGADLALAGTGEWDIAHFDRYCHATGAVPMGLAATILGGTEEATGEFARDLGLAQRLASIVIDLGADARRGRLYLPREHLERHGVSAADVLNGRDGDGLRALLRFVSACAREHYACALARLSGPERLAQLPSLALAAIRQSTLEETARDGYRVLQQRTALSPLRKLWIAWRTRRAERRRVRAQASKPRPKVG